MVTNREPPRHWIQPIQKFGQNHHAEAPRQPETPIRKPTQLPPPPPWSQSQQESHTFLPIETEKSTVGLDLNFLEPRITQKSPIPVGGVASIEMVRLLVQSRPKRRSQYQFSAWFDDSRELHCRTNGFRHMLQNLRAENHVEAAVRHWNGTNVSNIIHLPISALVPQLAGRQFLKVMSPVLAMGKVHSIGARTRTYIQNARAIREQCGLLPHPFIPVRLVEKQDLLEIRNHR